MTIWSSPIFGSLLPQTCLSRRDDYADFLFCEVSPPGRPTKEVVASVLGNLALGAAGALLSGSSPGIPIALSCIPIIVPMSVTQITSSASANALLSEDGKNFMKGITYVSIGQGTLAMFDFMFGDLLAGSMKAVFAGLGFYISQMDDGMTLLPSFTVVSFVNGCITMLSTFERMSARRSPLFSGLMPLYLNYMHLEQLLHPLLCFAGAYMGWQIIKELRRTGLVQSAPTAAVGFQDRRILVQPPQEVSGRPLGSSRQNSSSFTAFSGRGHSLSQDLSN